jgi:rare lipoprotein A
MALDRMPLAATALLVGVLATAYPAPALERRGATIVYANAGGPMSARASAVSADPEAAPIHYGYGRDLRGAAPIDLRGRTKISDTKAAPYTSAIATDSLRDRIRPEWLDNERVGAPYEAEGRWWTPAAEPGYAETGEASFYAAKFAGRPTANGEIYDPEALTAAHPTLPIPSLVQVTNLANGREAILRVNDRGPFSGDRVIDVSRKAADVLGFVSAGTARVHVRYLGPAPKKLNAAAPAQYVPARASVDYGVIPTAPAAAAPKGGYVVQVGAFADRGNAVGVCKALAETGSAEIEEAHVAGRKVHRVRIGVWASRVEAETVRDIVAEMGYPGAVVTAVRSPAG